MPSASELHDYTFDKFVSDFGMNFHDHELTHRQTIFNEELARVKAHNAKNLSWVEGINKFSAMTVQEKKAFRGKSKNVAKAHKMQMSSHLGFFSDEPHHHLQIQDVKDLPKEVDWRSKGVTSAVKDQGQCGSCWAFASTALLESHIALKTGKLFNLSPEQIAMCAPNPKHCGGTGGCEGATQELAFEYAKTTGLYQEFQYPYVSYNGVDQKCYTPTGTAPAVEKISGYTVLPTNDYKALLTAVATVGPVTISVDASAWSSYAGGVFNGCNQTNPDIDHAVVLEGYGVDEKTGLKYWLVRNSWSPNYGENGYIRILRTDDDDNVCGMDITPEHGSACDGEHDPVKVCGTCGILSDSCYPLI